MARLLPSAVLAACAILAVAAAGATEETRALPYFVSLGSGEVNLRTGPGVRYPIEWVYKRRTLPVEVIGRFDHWRQIRDWQGTEGWVHQSMLSAHRTLIVVGEKRTLRKEPKAGAATVAEVEPGVLGEIRDCSGGWCEVTIAGRSGWLPRDAFYGTYPTENVE
jgi:SH3-like domain-containing protein